MKRFRSFRSVLLIGLFVCGMSSTATAESVAELESALKNCKDSGLKMYNRYKQECGQIDQVVRHANEVKAWLDKNSEPPVSLRLAHTKCQDIYQQCEELQRRATEVHETCRARGRSLEECNTTQEYRQSQAQVDECWYKRYLSCRNDYNKKSGEWEASIQKQRDAYNSDMQKIRACQQLEGQYRSLVEGCLEIEKNLNTARGTARSSQQQASGTNCVSIDGPRTDGHTVTFTAILDQNTQANLLNMQGSYGFTWLLDGSPQGSTSSALTIQVPGGGTHQVKVQFWVRRDRGAGPQPGTPPVMCETSKPFQINQPQDQTPQGRVPSGTR
jgi:hypothetical protein